MRWLWVRSICAVRMFWNILPSKRVKSACKSGKEREKKKRREVYIHTEREKAGGVVSCELKEWKRKKTGLSSSSFGIFHCERAFCFGTAVGFVWCVKGALVVTCEGVKRWRSEEGGWSDELGDYERCLGFYWTMMLDPIMYTHMYIYTYEYAPKNERRWSTVLWAVMVPTATKVLGHDALSGS